MKLEKIKSELIEDRSGNLTWKQTDKIIPLTLISEWFYFFNEYLIGLAIDLDDNIYLVNKDDSKYCWEFNDIIKTSKSYNMIYYERCGILSFYKTYMSNKKINNIIK